MKKITILIISFLFIFSLQCVEKETDKKIDTSSMRGVGPISKVELSAIDPIKVKEGEVLFNSKCAVCHKMDQKSVGPPILGITKIRTPEWIMNMILNPEEMTRKDEIAKELLKTYITQMTFQNLTEKEVRALLDYFRDYDSKHSK